MVQPDGGMPASERASIIFERGVALTLARLLVAAADALLALVEHGCASARLDDEPLFDAALRAAQAGQAEAARSERDAFALEMVTVTRPLEGPLLRLTRAYRRAFDALGAACLLLASDAEAFPPDGSASATLVGLVERAAQCASALVKATNLLYTRQGLGTTAHFCAYIGDLENQADTLYRGAVSALFRLKESGKEAGRRHRGWTPEHARRFRLLSALEGLSDRCEEIADELLLLDYFYA